MNTGATNGTGVPEKVRAFADGHGLFAGPARLLVGFSGGADSTALLLLLRELVPEVELAAVHFNHGLRGAEADADARWCERFCARHGVPFRKVSLDVSGTRRPRESLEAAARRCRLDWYRGQGADPGSGATVVALGHHGDDLLEDFFLRLARGGNATGLTGLRPSRTIHRIRFIRPLLCLRRAEIEAWLRTRGITDWREDRTNRDPAIRRNAVRHRLLPLFRDIFGNDRGLHRALTALLADALALEEMAGGGFHNLTVETYRALPVALRPRVLRLWLNRELGIDHVPGHRAIARLDREVDRATGHRTIVIPLGANIRMMIVGNRFEVEQPAPILAPLTWEWRRQPQLALAATNARLTAELVPAPSPKTIAEAPTDTEYFAAADLPEQLLVRPRQSGDRLLPFGRETAQKVQDLMVNARIPRHLRHTLPVIVAEKTIIWIPTVRRAEFGRITDFTAPGARVCCLSYRSP